MLFNNITGDTPILLLDDMFSELDINKRNNILKYLDRNIQTIITTTDIKNINEKIKNKQIELVIDLKPALSFEVLDKRIQRDFEKYTNKEFKNSLNDLLPQKLISPIINLSKIDKEKKVHQITREQRENLVNIVKNLKINISGFMPLDMAIVTSGGINTKEINPKTMESKIVKGLYVVGELLDVDAYTGGYNLQIAFSTGVAAGKNS